MNATNLTGTDDPNLWQWGDIFVFMSKSPYSSPPKQTNPTNEPSVPISVLVTTLSLLLAFSKLIRAQLSFAFAVSWTWIITSISAYVFWREARFTSKKLHEEQKVKVNQMKMKALTRALERKMEEAERIAWETREKEGGILLV
jgi:hypothetical protein